MSGHFCVLGSKDNQHFRSMLGDLACLSPNRVHAGQVLRLCSLYESSAPIVLEDNVAVTRGNRLYHLANNPQIDRSPRRRLIGRAIAGTFAVLGGFLVVGNRRGAAAASLATPSQEPLPIWSQKQPPADGPKSQTGYGVGGDEGRALWFLDGLVVWKAVGSDTAGRYELVEQVGAADYAAPLHIHANETEGFYVVDGDLTMVIGDTRFEAGPGAFGYVPMGVQHAFKVNSTTAKFLTFITPPGLEGYFEELGQEATTRTLPPAGLAVPDEATIEAVAAKYGTQILGPYPEP
jgi:mannose-6-phosphate isomerase-like protein (cupin superfamily)